MLESATPADAPAPAPAPAPGPDADPPVESEGGETDPAPYGYLADGVTPRRKPGRKPKGELDDAQAERLSSVTQAPPRVAKPKPIAPAKPIVPVNYDELGMVAANLWFNVGQIPFGPDWAPDVAAGEPVLVKNAFRDYFRAANVTEINPAWGLVLVLGSYVLARLAKPVVKSRLSGAFSWLRSKWGARRGGA